MKKLLFIRRVVGESMLPGLRPGQLVVGWRVRDPNPGKIVIVRHDNLEKIKRLSKIKDERAYLLGDNPKFSTDSRSWGWLDKSDILAQVIWPR